MTYNTFPLQREGLHRAEYTEYYTRNGKTYKRTVVREYMPRGDYQDYTTSECITKYTD